MSDIKGEPTDRDCWLVPSCFLNPSKVLQDKGSCEGRWVSPATLQLMVGGSAAGWAAQRVDNFCRHYTVPESHLLPLSRSGLSLMSAVAAPPSDMISASPQVYLTILALSLLPHPDWSPLSWPELRASAGAA